jgi:uncharacterized damage-inducible protein DinB
MRTEQKPEVWLRGPLPGIIPVLQPVAHALLQAKEEINTLMDGFPDNMLYDKPAAVASAAFHLQHIAGVIDRLFTYAKGSMLSPEQLTALKAEGKEEAGKQTVADLLEKVNLQIDKAIESLGKISYEECLLTRGVGRAQMPSTVLGLLVHSAEHTMRHLGQLLVTVRILQPKQTPI